MADAENTEDGSQDLDAFWDELTTQVINTTSTQDFIFSVIDSFDDLAVYDNDDYQLGVERMSEALSADLYDERLKEWHAETEGLPPEEAIEYIKEKSYSLLNQDTFLEFLNAWSNSDADPDGLASFFENLKLFEKILRGAQMGRI